MALTRKMLEALGIDDSKVDAIITAHTEVTDALKKERDNALSKVKDFDTVQNELNVLKANGSEDYKNKYESEHKAFEEYKKQQVAAKEYEAKVSAYKDLLSDCGIPKEKLDKIVKVSGDEINALECVDGVVKDLEKVKQQITTDWGVFAVKQNTVGAQVSTPPQTGGSKPALSKDEIMKIKDTGERQKAIAENHELFGF